MSQLANIKHENFCRLIIEGAKYGWTQADIYKRAGYRADGHSAEIAASRLMKKDEIRRRLAELTAPATRKARITAESLLTELEETRAGAVLAAQYGAATAAITAKAKISGILVDRLEVGGVNEFSGCQTPQEVVDKLIEQEGAAEALAQLELLHALLIGRAGDQAIEVADAEPLPALTFDERRRTADRISGALPGYTKHGYR
jgi:hypothetical protein